VIEDVLNQVKSKISKSQGAIKIGIPAIGITFSNPITVTINVGSKYEGKSIRVEYQNDGEETWFYQTDCIVTNGTCVFTTTHATTYTANYEVSNSPTPTDVNVDINATITIDCKDASSETLDYITMNPITGTGQSSLNTNNDVKCKVITNNSSGYTLSFTSSTPEMINQNNDTISSYTPGTTNTPETWNVSSANSEWGARLHSDSSTYSSTTWGSIGTDDYTTNWYAVTNTNSFILANRSTETLQTGDNQIIRFGAEIGSGKFQPTGTYTDNVTFTAATN
jgi:hypothetical protein